MAVLCDTDPLVAVLPHKPLSSYLIKKIGHDLLYGHGRRDGGFIEQRMSVLIMISPEEPDHLVSS